MEDILESGKVKAIGVCNWSIPYLQKLKETWRIKPTVNQVELHPYLPQPELVEWCRKEGILVEAYGPLGGEGEIQLWFFLFQDRCKRVAIASSAAAAFRPTQFMFAYKAED